jgi:hypothetical protein
VTEFQMKFSSRLPFSASSQPSGFSTRRELRGRSQALAFGLYGFGAIGRRQKQKAMQRQIDELRQQVAR